MLKQRYLDYIQRQSKDESFDDSLKIKKKIIQHPQNNNQTQQKQKTVLNISQSHKKQQKHDKNQNNNNNNNSNNNNNNNNKNNNNINSNNKDHNIIFQKQNLLQQFSQNKNDYKSVFDKYILPKNNNQKIIKQNKNEQSVVVVVQDKEVKEKTIEKLPTVIVCENSHQNNSKLDNQLKTVGKQQNIIVLDEIEQKLDSYSLNRNKNLDFYGIDKVTFENDKKEKVLQSLQESDKAKIYSLTQYKQLIEYFQYDKLKPILCSIAYQKIFCQSIKTDCYIIQEENKYVQSRQAQLSKNLITIKHNPKVFIKVVGFLNNFHRNEDDPRIYHPSVQSKLFNYNKHK
ncbi:hypothetical protein ABPG74_010621 [Tetrahymena malaccensis]